MPLEIVVPSVGESINEVMIVKWLKSEGEWVETDESVAEIETDKATVEIPSPGNGKIIEIKKQENQWANVGEVVAVLEEGSDSSSSGSSTKEKKGSKKKSDKSGSQSGDSKKKSKKTAPSKSSADKKVMPSAERLLAKNNLEADAVEGTGKGGRILKEDVIRHLEKGTGSSKESVEQPAEPSGPRQEEAVPMSPLRRTIAQRLVEAQSSAALLTTFNEADMTEVIALRREYGESFQKKHEVKLGFMSFFVKASIEALKKIPTVNACIRGNEIVYHNYYDIGIAVSSSKGLVVPILRNAETMSLAEVERKIQDFGARGKENKIELKELEGGTFTISNGGIFGSLLSTPIVNPPQSGVLGLHAINDRPIAVDGAVVIRPMMYLALTYDHRIIDGREAVTFLKTLKELIEDPARILLEI